MKKQRGKNMITNNFFKSIMEKISSTTHTNLLFVYRITVTCTQEKLKRNSKNRTSLNSIHTMQKFSNLQYHHPSFCHLPLFPMSHTSNNFSAEFGIYSLFHLHNLWFFRGQLFPLGFIQSLIQLNWNHS